MGSWKESKIPRDFMCFEQQPRLESAEPQQKPCQGPCVSSPAR